MKKKALGRGLGALIDNTNKVASNSNEYVQASKFVPISQVQANPQQPRRTFNEESLQNLADSIRTKGIIQPILVQKLSADSYQIIAGERRWRAALLANFDQVPIIVADYKPEEILEVSLIENIQREDLNPIEEAQAYLQLQEQFNYTQEDLSKRLGKSRSHIANITRLINLDPAVQQILKTGKLTIGHARALLGLQNESLQQKIASDIIDNDLTVREVEYMIKEINSTDLNEPLAAPKKKNFAKSSKWTELPKLESELRQATQCLAKIKLTATEKGAIELPFGSLTEFNNIYLMLTDNAKS